MNLSDGLSAGEVTYLVAAVVVAVTLIVVLLVAIAAAEARSRLGEAERVAAIRERLLRERPVRDREPVGHVDGGRS